MDCTKIENEIGWFPKINFENGLDMTIDWYLRNNEWVKNVKNKDYLTYYEKYYGF